MTTNGTLPDWFYVVDTIISYSCMAFVFVTIPLYVMIVFIMFILRKHVYHGMFYRVFMVGAIIDIIALSNNYLGAIFPAKSWFIDFYLSQGTMIGHVYLILAWGTRFSQGFTVTLLALNRATAVCSPMRHKLIWNSKWANLAFVGQIGIGVIVGSVLIPQQFSWKKQAGGYYIQFDNLMFRAIFFKMAYALDTFFVLVIITTNMVMLIVFRRKYRLRSVAMSINAPKGQKMFSEKQRQENNLNVVSFVTCLVEIIYYSYIIYAFVIQPYMNTQVFYLIYNLLGDIYGAIGAWLMIALSKTLRVHIRNLLRCRPQTVAKHIKLPMSSMTANTAFNPQRQPSQKKKLSLLFIRQ